MEYDVNGFLEKNRDTVSKELTNVLAQSNMSLCKQVMALEEIDTLSIDANKGNTTLGGRVVISANRKQVCHQSTESLVDSPPPTWDIVLLLIVLLIIVFPYACHVHCPPSFIVLCPLLTVHHCSSFGFTGNQPDSTQS